MKTSTYPGKTMYSRFINQYAALMARGVDVYALLSGTLFLLIGLAGIVSDLWVASLALVTLGLGTVSYGLLHSVYIIAQCQHIGAHTLDCPDCLDIVSNMLDACPHCGCPMGD